MNGTSWTRRVVEALALVMAIAVVARVVFGLLGPLLPSITITVIVFVIVSAMLRGPHVKR